jgi:glycosyltransferase involved in cell wall biosynthesis
MTSQANAALYLHPDAYDTGRARLLGRHAAGESFLRGFLQHGAVEQFVFWNVANRPVQELEALVSRIGTPRRPVSWIDAHNRQALDQTGVLSLPTPDLGAEAWLRHPFGSRRYALCGLTHTTATQRVMAVISDLLIAPTEGHDALICTSSAVRASVESQLDGVRAYLEADRGPRKRPEPLRVTIPLGINASDFATSDALRADWRARLDIPVDAVVALYVGRFNVRAKMNPALMALALERAARRTTQPIYWVNSGWTEAGEDEAGFHQRMRALCPSVAYRQVDGRPPEVRFSIWSVADLFISFSDNIQETFGLTPVEAMAAGLPCVVSDWDGYRDTVRDGVDGFRIPTIAPSAGEGLDLAYSHANGWINYENYVGAAGQYTAVDLDAAAVAIADLAANADLRRRMGSAARSRAREVFDWAVVIPQYQALWAEQDARRRAEPPTLPAQRDNPFRPDPFRLFASYPTHHLNDACVVAASDLGWPEARALLLSKVANYSAVNLPRIEEAGAIYAWLQENGPTRVEHLKPAAPPGRWPFVRRGLLWLARYGVVTLTPAT